MNDLTEIAWCEKCFTSGKPTLNLDDHVCTVCEEREMAHCLVCGTGLTSKNADKEAGTTSLCNTHLYDGSNV